MKPESYIRVNPKTNFYVVNYFGLCVTFVLEIDAVHFVEDLQSEKYSIVFPGGLDDE